MNKEKLVELEDRLALAAEIIDAEFFNVKRNLEALQSQGFIKSRITEKGKREVVNHLEACWKILQELRSDG